MVELTLPETDGKGKVSRSIICLLNTKTMAQQRIIHWNVTVCVFQLKVFNASCSKTVNECIQA